MPEITLDSNQFKDVLKSAIVELLHENREEIFDLLTEVIEDLAMERAIAEGEATELTSCETIFQLLEPKG
jgi:hypothetical protein